MNRINNGGYAFPVTGQGEGNNGTWESTEFGMTLRDCFAKDALVGLLSFHGFYEGMRLDGLAADCYGMADAMLKAREA